ncbi:MAG: c-type cytochrome biogenesis protein CcmI [Candidatus Thioglobus sp.]|nr:c-type cytochrome biogenesis protein CcmI [Candidatus Thioglobus sp.]
MIIAWQFIIMIVLSCAFFAWFLLRPISQSLSGDESNIAINQQRQDELKSDINQGLIADDQYQAAESEIISTLATELRTDTKESIAIKPLPWILTIILIFSVLSLGIYSQLAPKMISSENSLTEPMSMSDSIERLESFIEENPDDFQALKMLGLAQIGIGKVDESIEAFENAYLINSKDIDLLLQFANAIAASQDGQFDGKSKVLIDEALSLDPQSIQVLYFSGIVAAHEGNLSGAIEFWEKALYLMSTDHPDRNIIEEALGTVLNLQVK